jgi:hypothetical protein
VEGITDISILLTASSNNVEFNMAENRLSDDDAIASDSLAVEMNSRRVVLSQV